MSKLRCKCGHVMAVHTMDEGFLYDIVPQKNIMDIVGLWEDVRENKYPDLLTKLYDRSAKDAYICPCCGRLLIESELDPNKFDSYVKEVE